MYQESVDKSGNSSKADVILFILLLVAFFLVGSVALYLESVFSSTAPRYIFICAVLVAIYFIYRARLIGFRYTIFHKQPEPVYDPRFDDMILHEDYPYPVGTIVFERIVSAKGTILLTLSAEELVASLAPGADVSKYGDVHDAYNFSCVKLEKSHSLIYEKDGKLNRLYFCPGEEMLGYIDKIMNRGE